MDIRADKDQANDGLSSALLILYLDSARNLPVSTAVLTLLGAFVPDSRSTLEITSLFTHDVAPVPV